MPASIDTSGLDAALDEAEKELGKEAMNRWFSTSQEWLMEAAGNRSGLDATRDSRGALTGRQENDLHRIAQSAMPPQWDDAEGAWTFTYTHLASVWMEYGTEPHEIKAAEGEMLAFEWPDAPPEVQEMFDNWEEDHMVYFKKVDHPGTPAIGYVRAGRRAAREFLENEDVEVSEL